MKAVTLNLLAVVAIAFAGTAAQASGFRCEGEGYNVKLFNKTSNGTRIPSMLVVSHTDASPATLLTRGEGEISKSNRLNTVRYSVQGNAKVGADQVILQVSFKEGQETLEAGEQVAGQLILVQEDGDREVIHLDCTRYLKGE